MSDRRFFAAAALVAVAMIALSLMWPTGGSPADPVESASQPAVTAP